MYRPREKESNETLSDSDSISLISDSTSDGLIDLINMDIDDNNFLIRNYSQDTFKIPETIAEKMKKLQIVKLDSVSISAASSRHQHIVNLQQSFNFATPFKSSQVISTQTSKLDLIYNRSMSAIDKSDQRRLMRATSLPPENVALTHLEKRVQTDVEPKLLEEMIGDGDKNVFLNDQNVSSNTAVQQLDLELADFIPTPVQCVMIKPK